MCTYRESGAHLTITCPLCGSNVAQVNGARQNELRSFAVVACLGCFVEFTASVRLERMARTVDSAEIKRDQRARAKANA